MQTSRSYLLVVLAWLTGCGNDSTVLGAPVDAGGDAPHGATDAAGDATHSDSAADAGALPPPLPLAGLRVANFSPGAPAVDLCLAAHDGGVFSAPLLGGTALPSTDGGIAADAGGPPLGFPGASSYLFVAPERYDVRVVVAGSTDCSAPLAGDLLTLPALMTGAFATVALMGDLHAASGKPGLQLVSFSDDADATHGAAIRFIHAAPGEPAVSFGTGSAVSNFKPLFSNVPYGAAGGPAASSDASVADAASAVDTNDYLASNALVTAMLSAHDVGATADRVVAPNISVAAGSVVTFVLISTIESGGDAGASLGLLECIDNAGTTDWRGACSLVSR